MNVYEKLKNIQKELKAPKNQRNDFGKYNYRSCEDILEAVKPLAGKENCTVTLSDKVLMIGERFYVEATATLTDCESLDTASITAYAREEETKKGMDGSQITGTASSYARKYALNGLFAIDDTKDADTNEHKKQTENNRSNAKSNGSNGSNASAFKLSDGQIKRLWALANNSPRKPADKQANEWLHQVIAKSLEKEHIEELTKAEYDKLCDWLEAKK